MSSYVRFFNSIKGFDNLKITMGDVEVTKNLDYPLFTEYFKCVPGEYLIKVTYDNEVVISETETVEEGEIITFCVVGSMINQSIFKVTDTKNHTFKENVATMRFVNLVPYDTKYDLYVNDKLIVDDLNYREVSDFYDFKAVTSRLVVKDAYTNEDAVIEPKMSLKSKYIYTSYIVGQNKEDGRLLVVNSLEGSTYIKDWGCPKN